MSDMEEFNEFGDDNTTMPSSSDLEVARDSEPEMDYSKNNPDAVAQRAQMWAVHGEAFYPCEHTVKQLPAGQYTIEKSDYRGIYFNKSMLNMDKLLVLPDSASESIIQSIKDFWSREEQFRAHGFLWKRGVLLYGPPGSGKTSTLQIISKNIIDAGGLSVYCKAPNLDANGLKLLRRIEPNRPIVVMLEDVDAIIQRYGESDLLALLDGELQIDNVVFIATTNYPEKLDKRFVNRPSRFDIVRKIGMPEKEARRVYLTHKLPELEPETLNQWVNDTTEFSIAHLKELIVSVMALGHDYQESIKRLKRMISVNISSSDFNTSNVGFSRNND